MENKNMALVLLGARLSECGYYLSHDVNGVKITRGTDKWFFDNEVEFAQWGVKELYNFEINI